MGIHHLDNIFKPKSIAVIGAGERKNSVGNALMKNLLRNGYSGRIFPINPRYKRIAGLPAFNEIKDIPQTVDLAVIATPIKSVPGIIKACGRAGVKGAVIISAGGKETGEAGKEIEDQIKAAAAPYDLRIVGPNCLGVINADRAMNASFAHTFPLSGSIAFLSQSGAVCTAILDLANRSRIGLSHVVSLGSMLDIDFADMIDYFGSQSCVKSIVMYMENLSNIRNFMSAARSVSRVKPIIVLKSGRSRAGAKAAASHTGALSGEDAYYDAAFQRAGILRVNDFEELLECAGFLDRIGKPKGPGLVMITNAGGPGVLAADALEGYGIPPVSLSRETIAALDKVLPGNWSRSNPVDILGDTPAEQYLEAVKICACAPETDALLLMYAPTGTTDVAALAKTICFEAPDIPCPLFTAWIGDNDTEIARQIFRQNQIATYDSAERAIRAFKNLYQYGSHIESLTQIPIRKDRKLLIDRETAGTVLKTHMDGGPKTLGEEAAKSLAAAYGIPVNRTFSAETADAAVHMAEQAGYPVVLKINSPDILHKSDCGGVFRHLGTAQDVETAFINITNNAGETYPDAEISGVTVQHDLGNADFELIIGARNDALFGPVILFGMGGVMTEVIRDTAVGLPPLNHSLAGKIIDSTKISRALKGFRSFKPVDMELLEEILIRVSRMVTDFPQISDLDINPLQVRDGQICAVDVKAVLEKSQSAPADHLIISTYPWQYEKHAVTTGGQTFFIRPIRPEDASLLADHFHSLSPRSIYLRFFTPVKQLSRDMLVRLTQIDYDRHIALVALMGDTENPRMVGVCRIISDSDRKNGEFAMAISDEWHGHGIGYALLSQCLEIARNKGMTDVFGNVLAENTQMLTLGKKVGFEMKQAPEYREYELSIDLTRQES